MTAKKTPAPPAEQELRTRKTYRVLHAFVHDGVYYAGQDVPEINHLPAEVRHDREARGYIVAFRAHVAPDAETPAEE
jgi:hypothetical protein